MDSKCCTQGSNARCSGPRASPLTWIKSLTVSPRDVTPKRPSGPTTLKWGDLLRTHVVSLSEGERLSATQDSSAAPRRPPPRGPSVREAGSGSVPPGGRPSEAAQRLPPTARGHHREERLPERPEAALCPRWPPLGGRAEVTSGSFSPKSWKRPTSAGSCYPASDRVVWRR